MLATVFEAAVRLKEILSSSSRIQKVSFLIERNASSLRWLIEGRKLTIECPTPQMIICIPLALRNQAVLMKWETSTSRATECVYYRSSIRYSEQCGGSMHGEEQAQPEKCCYS